MSLSIHEHARPSIDLVEPREMSEKYNFIASNKMTPSAKVSGQLPEKSLQIQKVSSAKALISTRENIQATQRVPLNIDSYRQDPITL